MFDVDDVVADRQITEVGDERGGFGFSAASRTGGDVGVVGEVLRAEKDELASARFIEIEDLNAAGDLGFDDYWRAQVNGAPGQVARFRVDGGATGMLASGAQPVGDLVFLQEPGEAFDFALIGRGKEDTGLLLHESVESVDERGDGTVEAHRGACGEVDFGEVAAVCVEDIDCAELVELDTGVFVQTIVEIPGRKIDVFRPDEIADAGAVVPLLDFVPPALALILDHGGLFHEDPRSCRVGGAEEVEEGQVGPGDRGEELPAGEDGSFSGSCADMSQKFGGLFAALEGCACAACAGQTGVDGGEDHFP